MNPDLYSWLASRTLSNQMVPVHEETSKKETDPVTITLLLVPFPQDSFAKHASSQLPWKTLGSLRERDLISVGKFCLLIFPAEVGASFILGGKGTYICSYSLNGLLCLGDRATCL